MDSRIYRPNIIGTYDLINKEIVTQALLDSGIPEPEHESKLQSAAKKIGEKDPKWGGTVPIDDAEKLMDKTWFLEVTLPKGKPMSDSYLEEEDPALTQGPHLFKAHPKPNVKIKLDGKLDDKLLRVKTWGHPDIMGWPISNIGFEEWYVKIPNKITCSVESCDKQIRLYQDYCEHIIEVPENLVRVERTRHSPRSDGENKKCYIVTSNIVLRKCEKPEHNKKTHITKGYRVDLDKFSGRRLYLADLIRYAQPQINKFHEKQRKEFYDQLSPKSLITRAEEKYGDKQNWDLHIMFRHKQYLGEIKSKVPIHIKHFGAIAGWNKSQEYKEPMTPHGEFENPKNINRSKIMIEFLVETLERLNIDVVNNIEKHDIIENE